MAGKFPAIFVACSMRHWLFAMLILVQYAAGAQLIDLKVGGRDFCSYQFKPGVKTLAIAHNLPKNGRIELTYGEAKKMNDSVFVILFPAYSPQVITMSVYWGKALYDTCKFRMPIDKRFSISLGAYENGDSIMVSNLLSLPTLLINSDTAFCEVISFSFDPNFIRRRHGDYQPEMPNKGARLTYELAKQLQSLRKGDRIFLDKIKLKCGNKVNMIKESLVLFVQ